MSFLLDALRQFGAGEQVIIAATLGLVVLYLLKGRALARTIATGLGTAMTVTVGTLVLVAVAIGAGWFDPQPGVVFEHVTLIVTGTLDILQQFVLDRLDEVVS